MSRETATKPPFFRRFGKKGEINMAEDFGDSTGSGLVNTAKQAAKEVVQAVVTKGAGIGGKGGGGISLSGEAKDMMAASKQLAGASAAPSREHLVAKPDLSR
jgi:deoxyribose-phosphate aldolase